MVWGFFTNSQLNPAWFGVLIVIGVQLLALNGYVSLRCHVVEALMRVEDFLNADTAKEVWLTIKKAKFKDDGVITKVDLVDYREKWVRLFQVQAYIQAL